MTSENRAENTRLELERAAEALAAARVLLGANLHRDAASRAYYAAFHGVRALLLTRGIQAKSHSGAMSLFNREFVRTGRLPPTWNARIGNLAQMRHTADYASGIELDESDGAAAIESAAELVRIADEVAQEPLE